MYSFDVFDTLITRTTATPWGIFSLMKVRMSEEREVNGLTGYVVDNFYELRIHSEELARKAGAFQQVEEISLQDIYVAMGVCGCLNEKQAEYLCQLEEDVEIRNVVGIPENIQKLKTLMSQGEKVILVSDMYLSEKTIRRMLLQVDEVFEKIPLYVSSEYGKRKTTGNLYRLVKEKEHVSEEQWIHIGDNIFQDIEMAYRLGITPEFVEKTEFNDFEKRILKNYGNDFRLQLMLSVIRKMDRKGTLKDAYNIGYRYAGPVLYSYAEWLVEEAIKKNINRLYFIARDGYLIKKIVDEMVNNRQLNIATSYIYGSRKAWRMPSLSKEYYNLYQLILWSHKRRITTLEELVSVMHLPLKEIYAYLPGTFAKNKENNRISAQELEYIVRKLSENENFRNYHLQKLSYEKRLVKQYLAQEIDISDDKFAFVDVSGGGLTQGCLRELLKDIYDKPIRTFFFKIDRVNLVKGSITDTFMPGFLENNLTIEMMCRAPHGQTKGYAEKDGQIIPVLEESEGELIIAHGFYEYEKGITDFSNQMGKVSEKAGMKIASMKNILLYLKYIAEEPAEDVLEYFASMPSSESGRAQEVVEYAPRLTKKDIKAIFLTHTLEPIQNLYKGTDLNYSIKRATESEKELIERYKKEHNGTLGRFYVQEEEKELNIMRKRYGRAALYPVRLLEEKIVIYGAGKFGQDLYGRLNQDNEHEVVLWVDKNADACRQQGLINVYNVSAIKDTDYEQIVVAVMDEKLADSIRGELEKTGIGRDKIVWLNPNQVAEWRTKGIG